MIVASQVQAHLIDNLRNIYLLFLIPIC